MIVLFLIFLISLRSIMILKCHIKHIVPMLFFSLLSPLSNLRAQELPLENDLWAATSTREVRSFVIKQLKKLEVYELDQIEAEPILFAWLLENQAQDPSIEDLQALEKKLETHQNTSASLLFTNTLQALILNQAGEKQQAQALYQKVFSAPFPKSTKYGVFKEFLDPHPLSSVAKFISASQLCRLGKSTDLSCVLAPLYRGLYSDEDLDELQTCAFAQDVQHCQPLFIRLLSAFFASEMIMPRAYKIKYCHQPSDSSGARAFMCTGQKLSQPLVNLATKMQGLSTLNPSDADQANVTIRPFHERLSSIRFHEMDQNSPSEKNMEFLYWRHVTLNYHHLHELLTDELLAYCQKPTIADPQNEFYQKSCSLLAQPEMWDQLNQKQRLNISKAGCTHLGIEKICLRTYADPTLRSEFMEPSLEKTFDRFSRNHQYLLVNILRYQNHKLTLKINDIKISQKTKWGLNWDLSGSPEFKITLKDSSGNTIYSNQLEIIKKEKANGLLENDYYLLQADQDSAWSLLVNQEDTADLHLKIEEIDPVSSDLVWETALTLKSETTQITHDGRIEINLSFISGEALYQKVLKMIESLPIEYYYFYDLK